MYIQKIFQKRDIHTIEKFQITFFPDISAAMRICFFVCLHKYKKIANGLSIRVGVWWSRDISSAGYSLLDNTHPMHRMDVIQKRLKQESKKSFH